MVCCSFHKTYRSLNTLQNHKCIYCDLCGTVFSTYQTTYDSQVPSKIKEEILYSNKHTMLDFSSDKSNYDTNPYNSFIKPEVSDLQEIAIKDAIKMLHTELPQCLNRLEKRTQ